MAQDSIVYDNGKLRRSEDIELAEKITELRLKKGPWDVIELLVEAWVKRAPEESEALKISIDDQKEMLADKKFGQTKGGQVVERRFTLIFPSMLQLMIRTQYKADELPFDSDFYREFARRFPNFKIAEKV